MSQKWRICRAMHLGLRGGNEQDEWIVLSVMLNNEQTNIFPSRRLIVGVREAFCQVFLRVAVAHFCQVIMYSEETPYASNVRIIWQLIGDRPSSPALGLSLRWDAYLSMKHKGHAKLKWHALKGSLETLSQMVFTDILLFIKQFHQNGAFTFIGMLALKAW